MAPRLYITSEEQLHDALDKWRQYSFVSTYLRLDAVVASLETSTPLVEPYEPYRGAWRVRQCHVCVHSGFATEFLIGSCAPPALRTSARQRSIPLPSGCGIRIWRRVTLSLMGRLRGRLSVGSRKISAVLLFVGLRSLARLVLRQNEAGSLCQFSYGIDTTRDKTLYEAQTVRCQSCRMVAFDIIVLQALERFMVKRKDFNRDGTPRRRWQDGDQDHQAYFIFSSQVFTKRTMYSWNQEHSHRFQVHPWLQEVSKKSNYFVNPNRPQFFELRNTKLVPLSECIPPYPQVGDLFWVSHCIQWVMGKMWKTFFTPVEWVRGATVSPLVLAGSIARSPQRAVPQVGEQEHGLAAGQDVENGTSLSLSRGWIVL